MTGEFINITEGDPVWTLLTVGGKRPMPPAVMHKERRDGDVFAVESPLHQTGAGHWRYYRPSTEEICAPENLIE